MVIGLGIDMIEVDRVEARINNNNGFRELVFSAGEITYCEQQNHKFEHYAARFAAKEAFFKALGTGWESGTLFNEIEVSHTAAGKPQFKFYGGTLARVNALQAGNISLSLTHIKSVASAVVIIEK